MKHLNLYEEFKDKTLKRNISKYNKYLKKNNRSAKVAWEEHGSQESNFRLVYNHLSEGDSILDYGCGIGDFINYLNERNFIIKDYLGVDINKSYIELAKETYNKDFQLITNINQINGKWDDVCAMGVFTWYITKKEFIKTIYELYNMCNKQVLLTLLYDNTPYGLKNTVQSEKSYWKSTYRYYDESLFNTLFPELNISFEYSQSNILIKIAK